VNEPLTTARFSALYGHWYPHSRDGLSFARAVLNQCRGVVLATRAIRAVNPEAELVQTEDVGKTFSTPLLGYQAEFENERRWLSLDLLAGRLDGDRPLRSWLLSVGVREEELDWFLERPCPPDVVGINHYLSSERFLDERLDRYPADSHGGNGRDAYADVLAARVLVEGPAGPEALLREAWQRYGLPLSVTEAHNACTREEQLRWLDEVWRGAAAARADGVEVRAVTVWSLLGAFGWDRLVTAPGGGRYEPGVYDLRAPEPRPTALAAMARALARDGTYENPVLATPGWWRRRERLWYPPERRAGSPAPLRRPRTAGSPILLTGAGGTLGRALARAAESRGLAYRLLSRAELDIADGTSVAAALEELRPWALVNAAGYARVDEAEADAARCFRENALGPHVLARACEACDVLLVTFSSDLVFDGRAHEPYVESDPPRPLSAYGESKALAEALVLSAAPRALVVRTSAFFGPWDEHNFLAHTLRALRAGEVFAAADDVRVSPTYVPDLVDATLDLLVDGAAGIWHLANHGEATWAELARRAAVAAGLDAALVEGRRLRDFDLPAARPRYSALRSERGTLLPPLEDALHRFAAAA
jgi:dTDP-4-dehydrorhamnose reductase